VLTSDQKGSAAEAAITLAAIELGVGVLRPVSDGLRYDLVFDTGARLLRVQSKWAVRRGRIVVINCRTCRRGPTGYIRGGYTRNDVDLVVGYCADTRRCYAVQPAVFEDHPVISLRLAPAKNNQLVGVRWACDYELERLDWNVLGAIAQLGERMPGRHEVAGSSPAGSTFDGIARTAAGTR
jgi:PD-(D/E)XK endonuclease